MSDSFKDQIAQMAMDDLFGKDPESQKVKETYQRTGRLQINQPEEVVTEKKNGDGIRVVKPIEYSQLVSAVSEEKIVESLIKDDYQERVSAIDQIANEAKEEATKELSKIIRSLR